MKTILILALSIFFLPAHAQDKETTKAAERLFKLTRFEQTIIDGSEAGFGMVKQSLDGQNLNAEEMAQVKDAFTAYIHKLAADPKLKTKAVEAYAKNFTADELQGLIAFYETPLGQKSLSAMPALMQDVMAFSQQLAQEHVGPFQEALTKILEKKAAREAAEAEKGK